MRVDGGSDCIAVVVIVAVPVVLVLRVVLAGPQAVLLPSLVRTPVAHLGTPAVPNPYPSPDFTPCSTPLEVPIFIGVRRKKFRGFKVNAGIVGGPRGCRRIFGNVQKDFLRKWQKTHYFSIFFKKLTQCVNFSRVWTTTTTCWEILRKFWKLLMTIL